METAKIIGLNIRKEASSASPKLGLLPRGAKIELGERSKDGKWAKIKRVISGQVAPVQQGGVVDPAATAGWVFIGELDPGPVEPEVLDEVVAPAKPVPIQAGALIGHIGEYQQHVDALPTPKRGRRPLLHLEVFTGDNVPAFIAQCRRYARTLPAGSGSLFVVEKGAKLVAPSKSDGEIGANEGVLPVADSSSGAWTKARRATKSVVEKATLGAYTSATKTYANGAVFTGWFVGAGQRTQDEQAARRLGYTQREVMMPTGAPLWVERAALTARTGGATAPLRTWSAFPLRLAHAQDPAVGLARVMSRTELERTAPDGRATDPEGNRWWKVAARKAAVDDKGASAVVGWACEKGHPNVGWQSPWAWPGFDFVEEGEIEPVDMWSTALYRVGVAEASEVTDFKARADKVDKSALLQKLFEQIDTNKNGVFEPHELRSAMQQPLLAQALSRMITRYESEWGGDDDKWTALDPLVLEGKPEWQAEKLRIKSLCWWPKVAAKVKDFPSSPVAYHIHPIGLVENFHAQPGAAATGNAPARAVAGGPLEKSGRIWVSRFMPSARISDLRQPFQGNVSKFFAALTAGGVSQTINTTLRPPQRSYLMYYAREVKKGLSPDKVPAFVPQDGDEPVNIDWAHRDSAGKPDLVAAKKAALEMDAAYGAAGAIGMAYRSNHNKGQAIDVRFSPNWGVGKSVVDANGKTVKIGSKQDIIDVGATFSVFHWNYAGAKSKSDDPHWSATGN